jgi:Protein of unknwon function (DUF3310)
MTIDWTKPIQLAATGWGQPAIPAEVVKGPDEEGDYEVRILGVHQIKGGGVLYDDQEEWFFTSDGVISGLDCFEARIENATATSHQVGGDHYRNMTIQPIDFIMANGLGFCEGNVIKYVTRYPFKNGLEDLKKARHYIDLMIENYGKE